MVFFLVEEDGDAELTGWLEIEIEGIIFEKTLTLREMIYLEEILSSLGARHKAW
jgi:hypothetical protein